MMKLKEHTCGPHIYMSMQLDDGTQAEIDVYIRADGSSYRTTADNDPARRAEIIAAFNALY